jgi:DNA-binding NarL/FixJ family response regulator
VRVVVADDAVIVREGLARLLEEAGFEVAGLAPDAPALMALVESTAPDVVVVDIRMPEADEGLQAAAAIRRRWPGIGVLVLSQYVRPAYALELLGEGTEGVGYLLKDRVADLDQLAESIRRIGERGSVLDPAVLAQMLDRPGRERDPLADLTGRERDVLGLMAEGRSNRAIGRQLWISEHTVEKHVTSIFGKLGLPPALDDHRRVLAVLAYLDRAR